MEAINTFITDNFTMVIIICVFLIMSIIGYIAKKLGFGEKISKKNPENQESTLSIKNLEEKIGSDSNNLKIGALDALDNIASNFNDGGLVIGDVNQNPAVTNQELGISDDLYAPFGDAEETKKEPSIEDLKIEEVSEEDDFTIIEKDKKKDDDDSEFSVEDLSVPLESVEKETKIDDIKIEDVEVLEIKDENSTSSDDTDTIENIENTAVTENTENMDPVAEEISNLVDNTFVINEATEDFKEKTEDVKEENNSELSKIEQFDIGESELANDDTTDFEIEPTTSLKLDEINEKIKSLKLEDLDNQNLDDDTVSEVTPKKKKKTISVKSVDEIKKETSKKRKKETDTTDIVADLPLPNLDEVAQDEKQVEETDDIWNF